MNHADSHFSILTENDNGYIGVCMCCHEFNFAYKNILLTFQEEDMIRFFDWVIENRRNPQHYMPLQHNRARVYSSPHSNLFLAFNELELDEVSDLYNETRLILSAQKILHANRMN